MMKLPIRILRAAVAGVAVMLLALPVPAQEAAGDRPDVPAGQRAVGVPELRAIANRAYAAEDYAAFRQAVEGLHTLRPWNADYMALLVVAHALNGDRAKAYEMMLTMQRQGLSYDFDGTEDSRSLRGTEAYEYINDLLIRQGEAAGQAELLFELPDELLLPTAIEWDSSREAFLVANARDGAVWRVNRQGETEELLRANEENGLWAIFGLLVDAENNRLWLTTAANENFSGFDETDAGRSALRAFTLDTLEPVGTYPVPVDGQPHRLGDLALAAGGDVYTVDTVLPRIYRLEKDGDRLKPFVASSDNVSFRGVAASDDGRMLYVADYAMGIMALDLEARQARRLAGPETLNLGGIEGLFFWDGHLVMIQNGNAPQRVMRLALEDDGMTVSEVAPLAIAQPFFDYPSFGTVVGEDLVFFANSHWVQSLDEPEPIRVARTSIAQAPNLMAPDLEKFWDEYYESKGMTPPERPGGG